MSKRTVLTRDFYDKLTIAFRECPGNATRAAARALCDPRMARRGWEHGWPQYDWAKPIKAVFAADEIAARARVQEEARSQVVRAQEHAEAEREAARKEAIDARKQEIQMLKAARGDVIAALVLAAELVPSMREVARAVADHCKSPGLGPDGRPLPPAIAPALAMGLLTRHATLIQKAVGAAETVIQLSRLERGAATAHVAIVDEENLTEEQIDEELAAIQEAIRASRALPAGRNGV